MKSWIVVARRAILTFTAAAVAMPVVAVAQIEEITVTARKREENIQEVPIAINAFGDEAIQRLRIRNVEDVARYSPSVIFDKGNTPTDNRIVIRGLSPTRGRSNAAILVDGIDITSEAINFAGGGAALAQRLMDVGRVEVVKGPQSALYGRSAFAGAIQYVTRDPGDELNGYAYVDASSEEQYEVKGAIGGPVNDVLGVRVNGVYWDDEGYYDHPITGDNTGGGDGWGLGLTTTLNLGDNLDIQARVEGGSDDYNTRSVNYVRHNSLLNVPQSGCTGGVFNDAFWCDQASPTYIPNIPFYTGKLSDRDGRQPSQSPISSNGGSYDGAEVDLFRGSLVANWDLGSGTISSWTGYMKVEDKFFTDGDLDAITNSPFSPIYAPGSGNDQSARGLEYDYDTETEQFSQELRWASNLDGNWQYTVGGLYWYEDVDTTSRNLSWTSVFWEFVPYYVGGTPAQDVFQSLNSGVGKRDVPWGRETTSWSAYGILEWDFMEKWKLTLEARYVNEDIDYEGPICGEAAGCALEFPSVVFPDGAGGYLQQAVASADDNVDDDYWAPKATVEWFPRDEIMVYGSVAKGVKPAGLSTLTSGTFMDVDGDGDFDEFQFDREELWVYELGAKTELFDNTLLLNGAAFYQDYEDKQISTAQVAPSGLPFATIENAGKATIWGIEIDTVWTPGENWTASLGYTYLNTEYDEFEFFSNSAVAATRAGNCMPVTLPGALAPTCQLSYNGNELEDVPEHSLVGTVRYERSAKPITRWLTDADSSWYAEADSLFQDERYLDPANTVKVDSHWLANARVGVMTDAWELQFYVTNVFDDDTILSAQELPGDPDGETVGNGAAPANWDFAGVPSSAVAINLPDERTYGLRLTVRY